MSWFASFAAALSVLLAFGGLAFKVVMRWLDPAPPPSDALRLAARTLTEAELKALPAPTPYRAPAERRKPYTAPELRSLTSAVDGSRLARILDMAFGSARYTPRAAFSDVDFADRVAGHISPPPRLAHPVRVPDEKTVTRRV